MMKKALLITLVFIASSVQADVLWIWSFESEAGLIVTDGEFSDTSTSTTFNIISFEVTASTFSDNIGATYIETQPGSGFDWDGNAATVFFRGGGSLTNGANFFVDDFSYAYRLSPEPSFWALTDSTTTFVEGPYELKTDIIFPNSFE